MSEIPDDIRIAAKAAFMHARILSVVDDQIDAIARALLAERERCAKIAEEDCRTALAIEHGYQPTWYVRARAIAAAIRNP